MADRLREAMSDAGIDQSELARAIGVTQGAISLVLLGKTRQSKFLPDMARELGVSYDWLAGKHVDKHSDRTVDSPLTSAEAMLMETFRTLPSLDRDAVQRVVAGISSISSTPPPLPSENALADMFEGLLLSIDRTQPLDVVARELAQLLPTGLSRLEGPLLELPRPPRKPGPPAFPAEVEVHANVDREYQR